ncbi:PspC domain-containing protein [Macrococcus carouselicus]|uniref:PspC domain-containing protein n=1 Tax=Macrococcus carouselicus TaxID=69969 RepID=A0A9Q8FRE0_9STAP|nr:PspC domain-containing protein [Macrococcus carouselicus]TDM03979.1 PspC domain-containing protein [Macrococcus carouselicus]
MKKRLTRSTSDRYLTGLLGGTARYLNMDSSMVRVIFLLVSFLTVHIPTFFLYFIISFFVPAETEVHPDEY